MAKLAASQNMASTLVSFALILIFTLVGIAGVLLPILPGIPFLLIAAIMASRHIPALENYLHQHPYTAKSMRMSKRFSGLRFWEKVQVCCWGIVKIMVDTAEWCVTAFAKLFRQR